MRGVEEINWPGGEHPFRLAIGELRAIEQKCDAGVAVVLMRLLGQQWKVDDVLTTLRLGLIGGGMPERDAKRCVENALDTANLYVLSVTAATVLQKFIMWESDDVPGEAQAGEGNQTQTRSRTEDLSGAPTTAQEPF